MGYPEKVLDEIRSRLPVSKVVSKSVALKAAGRELKGLSPFKKEKTPSFFVNDHKGSWFDFASGQSGDIFKFVMQVEGVSHDEAVERLAREAGVSLVTPRRVPTATSRARVLGVAQKLALVDKIGRELQSRYSFQEIDAFLNEFGVARPTTATSNSKWVYVKTALGGVPNEVVLQVAEELGVAIDGVVERRPPSAWSHTNDLKLFVSHISDDREKAGRLKWFLADEGVDAFVAHDDIRPTLEWQTEIERALATMDAFLALHTDGFNASCWTQQEIGYAVCRGVKIITVKMGKEDPAGFISKHQALLRQGRTAEAVTKEITQLLLDDPHTHGILVEARKARGLNHDVIPF